MKNLFCFIFVFAFLASCSDEVQEPAVVISCEDDYAECTINDQLFTTGFSEEPSEFLTTTDANCGIAAVLDTNTDILIMHVFDENHHITMRMEVADMNEPIEFLSVRYSASDSDALHDQPLEDANNYIQFEQHDSTDEFLKGEFNFRVKNAQGNVVAVTNGSFKCNYHSF